MAGTDDDGSDGTTRPGGDAKRDYLAEAMEAFDLAVEAESDNREAAQEDLRFARLSEQWPDTIRKQRELDGRPCLTINDLPAFIRQVVNDARQNKPSIKFHPVDSAGDVETAEIYNGLVRNIEYTSRADVAYDTAVDAAVSGGWGYFRIGLDYAYDDSFDLDITINRVLDPFLIYGDPYSTAADSLDWMSAFAIEMVPKKRFEAQWKGAEAVNWSGDYADLKAPWLDGETVMVAEWWTREEVDRPIVKLSTGQVVEAAWLEEPDPVLGVPRFAILATQGITPVANRMSKTFKTTQCILTGAEELERNEWPGRYIPIIPVYGEEVMVDGKRHFRSLIRDAKDPTRMENYWRSASTELVALAPRVPFIGPKGAFKSDAAKWQSINRRNWPFVEYDGAVAPLRQPLDVGPAAGAMQEALSAQNDKKRIMGLYDASLGQRSNETSGRAILARERQGDVSTFHFQDNLTRAVRNGGIVIGDLIPHAYTAERIIRVIGEDGSQKAVPLGREVEVTGKDGKLKLGEDGKPVIKVYDLAAGKYDLTVTPGPSYTTKREEAAAQMTEFVRAYPPAAARVGDLIAKNLDWPGADEFAERLKPEDADGLPPQVKQMIEEGKSLIAKQAERIKELEADKASDAEKTRIDGYKAETDRLKIVLPMLGPDQIAAVAAQTIMQAATPIDLGAVADAVAPQPGGPPLPMQDGGMPPGPPAGL